jgi:hypothetical protein
VTRDGEDVWILRKQRAWRAFEWGIGSWGKMKENANERER